MSGEGATGNGGEEAILTKLAPDETFNQLRAGTRLDVSVEVHLEGSPELGPTPPIDLAPGEVQPVELQSTVSSFSGWIALVMVGSQGR